MISALRKIEGRGELPVQPQRWMELCVDSPRESFADLFATHPSVESRIAALVKYSGGDDPGPLALPTDAAQRCKTNPPIGVAHSRRLCPPDPENDPAIRRICGRTPCEMTHGQRGGMTQSGPGAVIDAFDLGVFPSCPKSETLLPLLRRTLLNWKAKQRIHHSATCLR